MLLYFKTSNNLSFDKEVEFSMIAGSYTELPENTTLLKKQRVSIVKSAAILGANASGKTNLIKCMERGIYLIKFGAFSFTPNVNKQINKEKPTVYCFGILIEGNQFEYSFSLNKDRIIEERLIEYLTQKPTLHYHRKYNLETQNYDWSKFSTSLKENRGILNELKKVIPEKSLFLNRVAQFEIPIIKSVFNFFNGSFILDNKHTMSFEDLIFYINSLEINPEIIRELKKADFTLENIEVIVKEEGDKKNLKFISIHNSLDENKNIIKEKFDFELNESAGTQKYFQILLWLFSVLNFGKLLIIDELDNSLHTHLSRHLISMINNSSFNKNNTQLIFTTHDTNLLDQKLLRRDQIWFAEKDLLGNSNMIPLSDYKVKKGINLENSYLQGVYGGIPNIEK